MENFAEKEKGRKLGQEMEDFLNTFTDDVRINSFLDYMTKNAHRTLQQKYFGLVLKSIRKFADLQNFDGRNEYAVKTAKKMEKFMNENYIGSDCPCI